jgi:uncharacterized repeat protein (TIGR01451 family)
MKSLLQPANLGNVLLFLGFLSISYSGFAFVSPKPVEGDVLASCTTYGAYGEECTTTKSFNIEKSVRLKGSSTWQDKVANVREDQTIEFKISCKNTGDVDENKLKTVDILPDQLIRTGGDDLTEVWDNFAHGTQKEFIIEAKLKSSEFDSDQSFEKCIVNKVDLYQNENGMGSDTATVCYNNAQVEQLPKTGPIIPTGMFGLVGIGLGFVGSLLKNHKPGRKTQND